MSSENALSDNLPYWEFESSPIPHIILWDGSISSGFELLPLDIECFDESRINQLTMGLRAFANALPEGMTSQFMVKIETDVEEVLQKHESLVTTQNQFLRSLDQARAASIHEQVKAGLVFRPKLYFWLKAEGAERPGTFSLSQTKKFAADFEKGFDDRLQTLSQALEGAESALSSMGFTTTNLDRENLIEILYQHFNPRRSTDVACPTVSPRPTDLDDPSPRSQLVFGDLILDREDFVLDGFRTRVITLKTLPELTFAGMMSGFLALPFKYELLFSFKTPDQSKEIKSLEQKRRMAHSLSASTSNRVSDLESESRLSQTTDLLREIIETGQRIFQTEFLIILREEATQDGARRLNLHTKEVLAKFKTLSGSEGIQETVGSWKVFKSDLPLAPMNPVRAKRMKTNNLVDFFPLYGAATGDDVPVCLLKTRLGTLYSCNPYSNRLNNFNSLITGSSGSGKSFANNFLMLQQIARGTKVFVIDIGGSYKKMTEVLGGQYFEINLTGQYALNPFELKNPSLPPTGDRLKGLVSIVEQMVVDQGEKLSRFERVLLEAALTAVFEQARNLSSPVSPTVVCNEIASGF